MPNKRVFIVAAVLLFLAANMLLFNFSGTYASRVVVVSQQIGLRIVGPIQQAVTALFQTIESRWQNYFNLVLTARENEQLKQQLAAATAKLHRLNELEQGNARLRTLLAFKAQLPHTTVAAQVIGKDPLAWFEAVVIDKGSKDGIKPGLPVVMTQGIVGQVVIAAAHHSKVILITDQNSAVDGLVQRTRARGIVKGGPGGLTIFEYVLRKEAIQVGDVIISSGLDGVYPGGLPIGRVVAIDLSAAGMFQQVAMLPFVDFQKFEEVLVILDFATTHGDGEGT